MAGSKVNRERLLYLEQLFRQRTDEHHTVTMPQIRSYLESNGISIERRAIYSDIETLRNLGMDIIAERGQGVCEYYLGGREFELAELKLLVDAVQSFKLITEKKSRVLIEKLKSLVSIYDAKDLEQHVPAGVSVKSRNEEVYYNVDRIHAAIASNRQIRFQYFQWTVHKKMELRRDGAWYVVSPWSMLWDDENYYLIAYDSENQEIRHYRVDKMLRLEQTEDTREGQDQFEEFDIASYSKRMFGMFGGDTTIVTLECDNSMAGVMIDRFGTEATIVPVNDEYFTLYADVVISEQFLGWIASLSEGVKIVGPKQAVEAMKDMTDRLAKQYLQD